MQEKQKNEHSYKNQISPGESRWRNLEAKTHAATKQHKTC